MTLVLNAREDFAAESLAGFVSANSGRVRHAPGGVVRATRRAPGKVALVIGGGSGHYPAFAGVVGTGLADGAVCGDIFASPSTRQVMDICRAVDQGAGVLLSFGNYAGDVLNFSAAAARLRAQGLALEVLAVTDDVASAPAGEEHRRRGVAGESLAIDGLARQLGVSPTPVREALGQLEHTGLVTRTALKGYRVSPPLSPARMAELMDARAIVEVAAVRRAVPVAPEVITELEGVSNQHRSAAQRVLKMMARHPGRLDWATMRKYYTIDWDFHLVFLRNCNNPYLLDMAETLAPYVHRLRQSMNHGVIDVEQAVAEHAVVLEAVRGGDPESAAAAMGTHLANVRSRAMADMAPRS